MTRHARRWLVAACLIIGAGRLALAQDLSADLDRIFDDPVLARALMAVRVESLTSGKTIYQRNSNKFVMPASNMKLLTMSTAVDRLGLTFTYHTKLEASGNIADGVLRGDLVVVGSGDPSIGTPDAAYSPVFDEWARALADAGIRRVEGRLIGDDHVFDPQGLGGGWSWDYLTDGYAAPTSGLSYNENVALIRVWPGKKAGDAARVEVSPIGHPFQLSGEIRTGDAKSSAQVNVSRSVGSTRLMIRGSVPAGGSVVVRTTSIENPAQFFVNALRAALATHDITITGAVSGIDDAKDVDAESSRKLIADHQSEPLPVLGGYLMKTSQNFYAESLLKTFASSAGKPGTIANGRTIVRETLGSWGIAADGFVMDDGSGLSRYDYVTADMIVTILKHMWNDEKLRGPFAAMLPVAGHDGTLDSRMRNTVLDAKVEAKTGTIANVRSLSGYLETKTGERLVFSMIANNFTATSSAVDAVVEKALARLAQR